MEKSLALSINFVYANNLVYFKVGESCCSCNNRTCRPHIFVNERETILRTCGSAMSQQLVNTSDLHIILVVCMHARIFYDTNNVRQSYQITLPHRSIMGSN
jgi:hypothetical protein